MHGAGRCQRDIALALALALFPLSATAQRRDHPPLLDTTAVQAVLRPDEIAVAFVLAEPRSYRWVMSHEHLVFDRISGRPAIEHAATQLRDLLRTPANAAEATRVATVLGGLLFSGITTADDRPMVVIPDGALHDVPFEVLRVEGKLLRERHAVSYAPSVNALVRQRQTSANTVPVRQPITSTVLAGGLVLLAVAVTCAKLRKSA